MIVYGRESGSKYERGLRMKDKPHRLGGSKTGETAGADATTGRPRVLPAVR